MALQQVNLYRRHERAAAANARSMLSGHTVALGVGAVLATLIALSLFGHWRLSRLEGELASLDARQAQNLQMLEQAGQLAGGKTPQQIEAHIGTLASAVARRDQALGALASGEAGSARGFAARLEALARSHLEGLWLERMSFSSRQGAVAISGNAVDADLVPRYLEGLARQPVLTGTRFEHLNIERKRAAATIHFDVATLVPTGADAAQGTEAGS